MSNIDQPRRVARRAYLSGDVWTIRRRGIFNERTDEEKARFPALPFTQPLFTGMPHGVRPQLSGSLAEQRACDERIEISQGERETLSPVLYHAVTRLCRPDGTRSIFVTGIFDDLLVASRYVEIARIELAPYAPKAPPASAAMSTACLKYNWPAEQVRADLSDPDRDWLRLMASDLGRAMVAEGLIALSPDPEMATDHLRRNVKRAALVKCRKCGAEGKYYKMRLRWDRETMTHSFLCVSCGVRLKAPCGRGEK